MEEGDLVAIDIPARKIVMQVDDEVLRQRQEAMVAKGKQAWQPALRQRQVSRALQAYAATTTSAARGAVRDLDQLQINR